MNPKLESVLLETVAALKSALGDNLYSCSLYGSAVRGNAIEGVSDLNLLIVLNASTPAAHEALARVLADRPQIDPFILARPGFARSVRAFATKFASIRRHHRVLHGADPFGAMPVDPQLERFLCEQASRNLRLRLVYSFVTRSRHKGYDRFLRAAITPIFVQFSEALRLEGVTIPADFAERIPLFEREFQIDGQVLRDLLALKRAPQRLSDSEVARWHERIFPVIDAGLRWIEERWPA